MLNIFVLLLKIVFVLILNISKLFMICLCLKLRRNMKLRIVVVYVRYFNNVSFIYLFIHLESRWDPPPDGYVSIEEQEELQNKKEEKKFKKAKVTIFLLQKRF